eukprot:scaffold71161_cov19-Phaeocystis_antarctica.AAC.1
MLQQKLQLVVGSDCVKVDGVYGPRTTAAVDVFMRKQADTWRASPSPSPNPSLLPIPSPTPHTQPEP